MDKKILVIGLTGKTGAGKSTVAKWLKKKGCYIIDGDIIARKITEKGSDVLPALAKHFGSDIIDGEGNLDRKLLAKRAFADRESTDLLNSITHPAITEYFIKEIRQAQEEGCIGAVIDAAALLESECKNLCDKIVVVTAPKGIRLDRILARDGISEEQALTRINAQQPDEYYFSRADIIIRNYPPYDGDNRELSPLEELLP